MSADQIRSSLDRKRQQRLEAEKKAGEYRSKETSKRTDAAKARAAATKASSSSTAASKLRESERRENDAASAGKDAARWQARATAFAKEEATLLTRLSKAEVSEAQAVERSRVRAQQLSERQLTAAQSALEERVAAGHATVLKVVEELRAPKPEKLRVLLLGASADGGLRVGREQKRIRGAVDSARLRDQIELDVRPAATTVDLLDGITGFRPHIVHFSGHSDDDVLEFEEEVDEHHEGVVVTARAFAAAVRATDDPPLLVLLNSCNSAPQARALAGDVAPFAIGMSDSIEDADAIGYAAQFYAAIANGQSIQSAHLSAQAALELAGVDGADLPTLEHADGVDASTAVLVIPPAPTV